MAEFDAYAAGYVDLHRENIRLSGEEPEHFAEAKAKELARWWADRGRPPVRRALDFGCGVGACLPHLGRAFPDAEIFGIDVSAESLRFAAGRAPRARLLPYDGTTLPEDAPDDLDVVFVACVLHHVPERLHVDLLGQLRRRLRPGGVLAVFEHNPWNPVTRHIVATCPFDEDAVLISAQDLRRRTAAAGFGPAEIRYISFFPGALRRLRPLERLLSWAPVGAQYALLAEAPPR